MERCFTCKYRDHHYGICKRIGRKPKRRGLETYMLVKAWDESGLTADFITDPYFGCVYHQRLQGKENE